MFWRKKKVTGKTDPLKLGKILHELVMKEAFGFLDQKVGKETLKSFGLDCEGLGDELVWLGQFAAWSVLEKSFPDGNEDVMAAMQQAYYDELTRSGIGKSDITELDSYLQKRFLALSVAETKLSDNEFNEELGKMSAISISKSDPPSQGLSAVLLIFYNAVRYKVSELLFGVQLESVRKGSLGDVAASLAVDIFKEVTFCANSVDEFLQKGKRTKYKIDPPRYTQLALEFIFLFIHLTDKIAFGVFGSERRAHFMDVLVFWINKVITQDITPYLSPKFKKEMSFEEKIKVSNHYRTLLADKNQQFLEKVKLGSFDHEELNARNSEYSNYRKLFAEKNEPFKDTLFWEFGKHVSEVVAGNPDNVSYIMLGIELAVNSFKKLDIHEKLQKMSI